MVLGIKQLVFETYEEQLLTEAADGGDSNQKCYFAGEVIYANIPDGFKGGFLQGRKSQVDIPRKLCDTIRA